MWEIKPPSSLASEQPSPEALRFLGLQLLAQSASLLLGFFPLPDELLGVPLNFFGLGLLLSKPLPLPVEVL
jgi:hypothetical protein